MLVTIKRMAFISVFTSMMVVFTIMIPLIPVPILHINVTLQTLVVMIAGLLLSPIDAFISMLLYVLIGALGFPVFSGYKGGIAAIIGPTGGFIISFPIIAYLISFFNQIKNSFIYQIILNVFFGIVITYLLGAIWLDYYIEKTLSSILSGMIFFLPFDLFKVFIASYVGSKLKGLNIHLYKGY